MMDKINRIGILMGGPSSERAVSLRSGQAVAAALQSRGWETVEIDILREEDCAEFIRGFKINFAFIALHGRFGEDGKIQQILEDLGIPYTGSGVEASILAMDKIAAHRVFAKHNISTPGWQAVAKAEEEAQICLARPWVVKPANEGSSIGLSIVREEKDLAASITNALRYDEKVIIEEYIGGREITVGILGDEALPIVEIVPKNGFYDYAAKYTAGMTQYIVPARLNKNLSLSAQELARQAHQCLGCRAFSRVDMRIEEKTNKIFVLEVNTIPGLTQTSLLPKAAAARGLDFTELCLQMMAHSYNREKKNTPDYAIG